MADEGSMESMAAIRNLDLSNQVSVQVAKKAMDVQKDQGKAAVELLRQAAQVGKSPVVNGRLDVLA
jgi:hypothetical protein